MSYTLVVVDMQYRFRASRDKRVKDNCIREVKLAIKRKASIIILEYIGFGHTLPSIKKLISSYPRALVVRKLDDDGSREVMGAIKSYKLSNKLRMVGVNTDCCVYATTASLARKNHLSIDVIANACNSHYIGDHLQGLHDLKRLPGVKIKRK